MGKIIRNGIEFSSTSDTANNINYDNTLSGLNAVTAQEAIDEVNENVSELNSSLGGFQFQIIDGIKQVSVDGGETWENFKSAVTYEQVGTVPAEVTKATCTIDTNKSQFIIVFFYGYENRGGTSIVYFNSEDKTITGLMSHGITYSLSGNKITFTAQSNQISRYSSKIYSIY